MSKMKYYPIKPNAKPRMTQSDKWKTRPCVMRYRAFKDLVRLSRVKLPEFYHVVFFIEMPKSWTQKKKNQVRHKPHQQTPDKDNLEKALLDALYQDDSHIWTGEVSKIWADYGGIVIIEKKHDPKPIKEAIEVFLSETRLKY